MQFKPVTNKYIFDGKALTREYPEHLTIPIASWIKDVLFSAQVWIRTQEIYTKEWIDGEFLNNLDIYLRESFPRSYKEFLPYVMANTDRTTNIIALCLQNYAQLTHANKLERILSIGGSGYAVLITTNSPSSYQRGIANLVERVPEIVQQVSEEIFNTEALIKEAWVSCYSRNPDYEKVVSKCVDALEGLFKKHYFPSDSLPSLGKFIKDFISNESQLIYKGDTLVSPKNLLTNLAGKFIPIRGHHTSGTGRAPTKEEAEFVLHYTIFVFSLHQ